MHQHGKEKISISIAAFQVIEVSSEKLISRLFTIFTVFISILTCKEWGKVIPI